MKKNVLLIITSFFSFSGGKNYIQRELETLLENDIEHQFDVKFFHPNFQGFQTLDRHIEKYMDRDWNVFFFDELDEEIKIFYKNFISGKKNNIQFVEKLNDVKEFGYSTN